MIAKLRSMDLQKWLNAAAALSVIAASLSVLWLVVSVKASPSARTTPSAGMTKPRTTKMPSAPISLEGVAIKGRDSVRVGVLVYSDFQCPYCGSFARDTLPSIMRSHIDTGRAFVGFRHLPLERIHPLAFQAAAAAECGHREGQFWSVHDMLFAVPELKAVDLRAIAQRSGLDLMRFQDCVNGVGKAAVARDVSHAAELGINGTPTFLFGVVDQKGLFRVVRRESGAIPVEAFSRIFDEVINHAQRNDS